MYSNRIVRTKISQDLQAPFKRQAYHTQTGSVSPCRITADQFYTAKNTNTAQQNELNLKKKQVEAFISEIEKLNEILKKKTSFITELQSKLSHQEQTLNENENQISQLKQALQQEKEVKQNKISQLLVTNETLKQTNINQQQELESLICQIEQYNKESQKIKETLRNSQSFNPENEMKQLKYEINSQKQEITKLQIQLLDEKKEKNQKRLQDTKILEKQLDDQQNIIDNQKQQIAQLRKTINLLEQNVVDSFSSENTYTQLLNNYNHYKEQVKEQEENMQKIIQQKELENNNYLDKLQNLTKQIEQQNLQIITLQTQNDKLKIILKKDEIEIRKNTEPDMIHPLTTHNRTLSKIQNKEYSKNQQQQQQQQQQNNSQHQQLNFIKEQFKQIPQAAQYFEKDILQFKNKLNSPTNFKFKTEGKDISKMV